MSLLDIVLLFTFLFLIFYISFKHKYNYWKEKGVPFRTPIFPFGHFLDITLYKANPSKYFADLYNEFDAPCIGFYSFLTPHLIIKDLELVKTVLIKEFNSFANRSFFVNEKIDPVISNGLLGIKMPQWKELRKKLSPVFTAGKIKMMTPLMIECAQNLENYVSSNLDQNLEMKEVAAKYATDVITSCAFGLDANSFKGNNEFWYYGQLLFAKSPIQIFKSMSYVFAPVLVKAFRYTFTDKRATDYFRKVFHDTLKARELSKVKRNDLVDILNEIKNLETSHDSFKFEGDRILAQAISFFGAGHETSSSTIAFTLHELSVNPNIQDKVRKEILSVVANYGGVTYDAIQEMKYLHMVIFETLRKYSVTPIINREAVKDYKDPKTGLVIEKGTSVMISQEALHFDPRYFPNPTKYDPERFNNENKHNIPNYAYLPFGDGPRNCIGERFGLLSAKLGIIYVLKKFKVEPNSETRDPIIFSRAPILQSKYGVPLTCRKLVTC